MEIMFRKTDGRKTGEYPTRREKHSASQREAWRKGDETLKTYYTGKEKNADFKLLHNLL